jgi:hypothetical protein
MNTRRSRRELEFQRGEGYIKLALFLIILGIVGYLAIQNVPTYFAVQNMKHDLAELARGTGVIRTPAEKVAPQASRIAQTYETSPNDVKVENLPSGGIKITLNTNRKIDFIVTNYDWHIAEVYQQSSY